MPLAAGEFCDSFRPLEKSQCSSGVEQLFRKQQVMGSNPITGSMFVVPSRTHYNPAAPADTPLKENLQFTAFDTTTSDSLTLKCWFVTASPQPVAGTVLILHGWGGSKEWVRE